MCGICGIIGKSDKKLLKRMCDSLIHRGPDSEGMYVDDNVSLGVRRLSIIDLETGNQPISNEDGTLWIIYNGEVYNYQELRDTLRKKGHNFKTTSDTEVVLHSFEEYGDECVQHFNGAFAFVIWDTRRQELFAARDRIGIKPFYYWNNGKYLIFASEIKAILQDPAFERRVNVTALNNYVSRLSVWGGDSMFEGIHRLEPAHTMRYKNGKIVKKKYWDLDFSYKIHLTEEEYCERLRVKFKEAVQRRLVSDVPLGVFLSGGVDSSSIVAMMSELCSDPVQTFACGFEAEAGDTNVVNELNYARKVAEHFGTDHHEFVMTTSDLISSLPKLLWFFDEPFAGTLPQYNLAVQSNSYVKVALGGTGGDELFGDYGRSWWVGARFSDWSLRYLNLPFRIRRDLELSINKLSQWGKIGGYLHRYQQVIEQSKRFGDIYIDGYRSAFSNMQKQKLFQPWVLESLNEQKTLQNIFQKHFTASNARNLMDRVYYVNMKTQLVDEYCYWSDLLTMGASVETRLPFLDHKFVEFVISIPPENRTRRNNVKYLFKKSMSDILPKEVLNRPKGGFSLPLDHWLRTNLRGFAEGILDEKRILKRGYFCPDYVNRLMIEHMSGKRDNTYRLWILIMFDLWHEIYIDRNSTEAPKSLEIDFSF